MPEDSDNQGHSEQKEADRSKLELTRQTVKTKVKLAINLPWLLKAYVSRTWFVELKAKKIAERRSKRKRKEAGLRVIK
jgi:hypothetical protein